MTEKNGCKRKSRRTVLRTTAGFVGGAAFTGVGATSNQTERDDKIYQQALKIREKTGSQSKFKQFLGNHGFGVAHRKGVWHHESDDSDEISKQAIDLSKTTVDITLTQPCEEEYTWTDFRWIHDVSDGDDYAGYPVDGVGIYFSDSVYTRINGTSYTGSWVTSPEEDQTAGALGPTGIGFNYDDAADQSGPDTDSFGSNCGIKLRKKDLDMAAEERQTFYDYHHLYSQGEIAGFSISYPVGVSLDFSTDTKEREAEWSIDERQIEPDCDGVT